MVLVEEYYLGGVHCAYIYRRSIYTYLTYAWSTGLGGV